MIHLHAAPPPPPIRTGSSAIYEILYCDRLLGICLEILYNSVVPRPTLLNSFNSWILLLPEAIKVICWPKTGFVVEEPQCTTLKKKKKRTIPEIQGEKSTVRSCDIMLDHGRSAHAAGQGHSRHSATFAPCWSRVIKHDNTWWNSILLATNLGDRSFFLSRVVPRHF